MVARIYSIGEAAHMVGVTPKTLRVWDKEGRIKPAQRVMNGARLYTDEDIDLMRVVVAATNRVRGCGSRKK